MRSGSVFRVPRHSGRMVFMTLRNQIDHGADLKGELVGYALTPGFARLLASEMSETLEHTDDRQSAVIYAVESMLFDRPERGGRTVLERYLLGHKQLSLDDRAVLESWRERAVYGVFEVIARKSDRLTLVNVIDELSYEVYSTLGAAAISGASRGSYVLTRVLPVGDSWILSGIQRLFGKRDRRIVGALLAGLIENDPTGAFRNPVKRERALEINGAYHDVFLGLFGADSVAGTGREAAEHLRRFIAACSAQVNAAAPESSPAAEWAAADAVATSAYENIPDELLNADDVVLLNHKVKGFALFQNYGQVEDAHHTPPSDAHADGVALVREYLNDESIPAYVLARLASAYPETVDALYRLVLERPEFRWAVDGDALLRQRKPESYATADVPDLVVLPQLVIDAMADASGK